MYSFSHPILSFVLKFLTLVLTFISLNRLKFLAQLKKSPISDFFNPSGRKIPKVQSIRITYQLLLALMPVLKVVQISYMS